MGGDKKFTDRYGPWGLVAGASEGLGETFAEELARRGLNVVLVARRGEALQRVSKRLRDGYSVESRTVIADMGRPDMLSLLEQGTKDLDIGLLVCNAAVSPVGGFLETGLDEYMRTLDVNCRGSLGLIHAYGRGMAQRGRGGIIVMSSMAGFQGSPRVSVYGATKAFLINLSEALWKELGPRGVDVTVCCAAAIRTPGYLASRPEGTRAAAESEPKDVVAAAFRALGKKPVTVAGFTGAFAHFLMGRLFSRKAAISLMEKNTRGLGAH